MAEQEQLREMVFHPQGEKGAISFCRKCQQIMHYCCALVCRPDLMGCLEFYHPDGKTLKWFLPFTLEEFLRGRTFTTEEYEQRLLEQRLRQEASKRGY